MMNNIKQAEKALNYTFKDKDLLIRALTLASASEKNNQLLEFFGDAILEFIVSERIFSEGESEGELTERRRSIISDYALTPISKKLGLDKFVIRNKNDTNNKKSIPSLYEAVTAAIYLDGGLEEVKKFVFSTLDFSPSNIQINYKGELQELLQSRGEHVPQYKTVNLGDAKKQHFRSQTVIDGQTFYGEGDSVKQAQFAAAKSALEHLKK